MKYITNCTISKKDLLIHELANTPILVWLKSLADLTYITKYKGAVIGKAESNEKDVVLIQFPSTEDAFLFVSEGSHESCGNISIQAFGDEMETPCRMLFAELDTTDYSI